MPSNDDGTAFPRPEKQEGLSLTKLEFGILVSSQENEVLSDGCGYGT